MVSSKKVCLHAICQLQSVSNHVRTVENVFGIISFRFWVYKRSLCISAKLACNVVKACIVLHNLLLGQQTYFGFATNVPCHLSASQWSSTVAARSYLLGYIHMNPFNIATNLRKITPIAPHEDHRRNDRHTHCICERAIFSDNNVFLSALAESRGETLWGHSRNER